MYTSFSNYFTDQDKRYIKAFIEVYREQFIKLFFVDNQNQATHATWGDLYLGHRTKDNEQVFQAMCQNLEVQFNKQNKQLRESGQKTLVETEFVNKFMVEIDNKDYRHNHVFKEAFLNAASCDYYYAYEKDWGREDHGSSEEEVSED